MPSQCRFGVNAFWLCCRMAIGWLPMRSFIGPTSRAKRFSKWNPIEYRLFSHISLNWAGQPLRDLDVMLGFIRGTTTTAGLKVEAYLDEQIYRNGRRVTEEKLRGLALSEDDICPRWNYTLAPRTNR